MKEGSISILISALAVTILIMDVPQGAKALARKAPKTVRKSGGMQQSASSIDDASVGTFCITIGSMPVRGGGVHTSFKLSRGCLFKFLSIVAVESFDLVLHASEIHEGSFDGIRRLGLGRARHHPSSADIGNDTNNEIIMEGLLHFFSKD